MRKLTENVSSLTLDKRSRFEPQCEHFETQRSESPLKKTTINDGDDGGKSELSEAGKALFDLMFYENKKDFQEMIQQGTEFVKKNPELIDEVFKDPKMKKIVSDFDELCP